VHGTKIYFAGMGLKDLALERFHDIKYIYIYIYISNDDHFFDAFLSLIAKTLHASYL
jgi:hypothetical protein